jgi:hypothetical protein
VAHLAQQRLLGGGATDKIFSKPCYVNDYLASLKSDKKKVKKHERAKENRQAAGDV